MSTQGITKKRPRRLNSKESSSSEEMESLKPPKDVLGLGKHLVRELDFEDGVDTLGRWMAHHLAELINEAEGGTTEAKRAKAAKKATETIFKIWERRRLLPGEAYPLAPYENALTVLHRLRPDDNPFRYHSHHHEAKRDQLAAILFDRLTRLIIALLLLKVPSDVKSAGVDGTAVDALSDEEQKILRAIHGWFELLTPATKSSGRRRESKKGVSETEINLKEVAVQLIDDISASLAELRDEFQPSEERANEP
jgi:hypothetical protein